jgi:hypothetical protein
VPLSDSKLKNAKPKNKLYKLADLRGLYLALVPKHEIVSWPLGRERAENPQG